MCVLGMGQLLLEGSKESFLGGNFFVLFYMLGTSVGAMVSLGWPVLDRLL